MIAAERAAASLRAMLYLVALMSLVGAPARELPKAARTGNVVAAGAALLGAAAAMANVDLSGEIRRSVARLRPAAAPLLRRE